MSDGKTRPAGAKPAANDDSFAQTVVPGRPSNDDGLGATIIGEQGEQTLADDATQADASSQPKKKPDAQDAGQKKAITQLGDFKLIRKLGQGGMGEVYLAKQVSLDRMVALKTLSKQFAKNETFVKRFIREARSMAKIDHPNAVRVYAAESNQGVHYAAIEFIDGKSMQDWIEQLGKLSIGDAVHVVLRCAEALKHAHDMNMIHRDIKPDNILVTQKGVVKVADFGLAKAIDDDVSMTQSGTGMGTPLYMAPEQARNAKHVDQRTDIYALGVTLYQFLTGALPFSGGSTVELLMAKEQGRFTPAQKANPEIPDKLDLIVEKMMMKDPQHRYATCDEVIAGLEGLGLEAASLSFIDAPDKFVIGRKTVTNAGSSRTMAPANMPGQMLSSAEVARKKEEEALKQAGEKKWFIRHKNVKGDTIVSQMTTEQVIKGIRGGLLDVTARASKSPKEGFVALAQFVEFETYINQQLTKANADARGRDMKQEFAKLDKQYQRRHWKRFFQNLFSGTKGLISLAIWLAVVCAALYGLYAYGPALWKVVAPKIGMG